MFGKILLLPFLFISTNLGLLNNISSGSEYKNTISYENTIEETNLYNVKENGEVLEVPICKTECHHVNNDRGHIQQCHSNHILSYTNINQQGYTYGGVVVSIDGFYSSATYYLYIGGINVLTGSFDDDAVFYCPGTYYLQVECLCGINYNTNFTINSSTVVNNEFTTYYGSSIQTGTSYLISHEFSYSSNSIYGHVHSKIIFPELYNNNNLISSMNFGDYFELNYLYRVDGGDLKIAPDNECVINTRFHTYAPYGYSDQDYSPSYGVNESQDQVINVQYLIINDYDFTYLPLNFDIYHYLPNTYYSNHPVELMYGYVSIDFDVQSINSNGLPFEQYHPIQNIRNLHNYFRFYLDYRFDGDSTYYGMSDELVSEIIDFTMSTIVSLVPIVGQCITFSFDLLVLVIDAVNIMTYNGADPLDTNTGPNDYSFVTHIFLE